MGWGACEYVTIYYDTQVKEGEERGKVPADSYGEGTIFPDTAFDNGHLAAEVAARSVEDLMAVAVLGSRESALVGVAVTVAAVMGVCVARHCEVAGLLVVELGRIGAGERKLGKKWEF